MSLFSLFYQEKDIFFLFKGVFYLLFRQARTKKLRMSVGKILNYDIPRNFFSFYTESTLRGTKNTQQWHKKIIIITVQCNLFFFFFTFHGIVSRKTKSEGDRKIVCFFLIYYGFFFFLSPVEVCLFFSYANSPGISFFRSLAMNWFLNVRVEKSVTRSRKIDEIFSFFCFGYLQERKKEGFTHNLEIFFLRLSF